MFDKLDGEKVIIFHLLKNSAYFYRVFSKLKKNVFKKQETQTIYEYIQKYYREFEKQPTMKELALYILNSSLPQHIKNKVIDYFKTELRSETEIKNFDFLIDFTEKYLKKVALTDAILESVEIIKKDESLDGVDIITKFEKALDFKFDTDLGMDLLHSLEERFKHYKEKHSSIPTGIQDLDKILGGGFRPKTLALMLGASHTGKSAMLCAISAGFIRHRKNGLYITLEMPETDILKRIDANLLDMPLYQFEEITWEEYKAKYDRIKDHIGNIYVKEYSAGSFSVFDLEKLKYDIEQENNIKLDFIVIDYLGLMKSTRVKLNQGSYLYFKSVAEELHGFAKKHNIPVISAFQLNRSAYNNLEAGMESVSESLGVIMTADVSMLMLTNEQLKEQNQIMIKTEKNRYTGKLDKIILEVDWSRMKFKGLNEAEDVINELDSTFKELSSDTLNTEIDVNFTSTKEDDFDFDFDD